jgi:hypothetical protein
MRGVWLGWTIVIAAGVSVFVACGNKTPGLDDDGDGGQTSSDDASGSSSGSASSSGTVTGNGSGAVFTPSEAGIMITDSACKAGKYEGSFAGSYSSSLILGIPLTVTGNVDLTLNQEGGTQQMCQVAGEFEMCSNVFTLSNGTITGVANKAGMIGDAAVGGYPYFCSMTGTLDCAKMVLVGGWIQCTYCAFDQLTDGGTECDGANIGGHFAGPLTANYDTTVHAFIGGMWNGAEALAGNDGGSPGPDGGSIDDYLALDGGYGFLGKFGGSGTWNATLQP